MKYSGNPIKGSYNETFITIYQKRDKTPVDVRFNPLFLVCLRIPILHQGQLPVAG
jgi:hypothetical protein